ncbi:energy-coupling factor transport system permease protein [Phyllobacterium trifolii]|uniref:Energy-coupling factor transport system permease protein n=1 Tax=Phyllobacterium trifolii TaxID=300193 RepID=A0A839UI36_9HYPH|nr:energy-coupling factor transporter transmembrane component T [Phyllobacterium trifolii]MBB3149464.1 energy-coupling factor transport system permease protein [Phyllobacterium trifolii]
MMRRNAFQFRSGRSLFHRLDPLSKLAWLLGVSLLAFGAYIAWIQIAIALAILGTALFLARLSPFEIVRGTWLFIIACLGFFVVQSLTLPGKTIAFHVLSMPIYAESADYALASALRIYTIILSSMVFVRTTDPRDLAVALVTQMRVPYRIAYAFFIALRIVPTIEEEIKIIRSAQAVRGVARKRGIAGRILETKRYAMPLLVGSLRRASMMVMSMEGRAFGAYPQRTFVDAPRMSATGIALMILTLAAVIGWYTSLALGLVHSVYVFAPN